MKKHIIQRGASEFHEERDRDLHLAYKQAVRRKDLTALGDIIRATVESPAPRFYVSEERAARIVYQWMIHQQQPKKMLPMQRMMYEEIIRRVTQMRQSHPKERLNRLVWEVICQPAPRFYLTEKSAYVILRRRRRRMLSVGC